MATTVDLADAAATLAVWVEKVRNGETVSLTERGRPVVQCVPASDSAAAESPPAESGRRVLGAGKGTFLVHGDFDEPLPDDLLDEFHKDDLGR